MMATGCRSMQACFTIADVDRIHDLSDSHFHSAAMAERGLDVGSIIAELAGRDAGILVDVAIEPEDLVRRRELTGEYPKILYSAGIHPSRSGRVDWSEAIELCSRQLETESIAAVGELGLDWYREYAPRPRQIEIAEAQLALALRFDLPVIVHNREADADVAGLLRTAGLPRGGVMHCFSSGAEWVAPFLDLDMYISFAGNVTFPSAQRLREAAALVPDDRLLVETDAPFLAPVPHRGRPNHPGLIIHTYEMLAEVRGVPPRHLIELVATNVRRLFLSGSASRESAP